jgi:ADP-heptose:LPS heptosyltransferase
VEPELPALAAALAGARAYLGGDSGVSHLAAAVGAPSVILFPPAHLPRWTPWSPTARAIAASGGPDEVRLVTRALDDALTAASR